MSLKFHSTNYNTPKVDFKTALLTGLALDKGLYTPDEFPQFQKEELLEMAKLKYPDLAYTVLSKLISDQLPADVLKRITKDTYNFPVPIDRVYENKYVLRLDKGPTASFKDFAARVMARLMQYYTKQENKELLILTATSGDTGGAVASAFYGMDKGRSFIPNQGGLSKATQADDHPWEECDCGGNRWQIRRLSSTCKKSICGFGFEGIRVIICKLHQCRKIITSKCVLLLGIFPCK
jgi:threonine synthase